VAGVAPTVDDNNPCTSDSCSPILGVMHAPLSAGTSCSDGNACNGAETCNGLGACLPGTPPTVDDGNPCTNDTCISTVGVVHVNLAAGLSCSDGNACNGAETCNGSGACVAGAAPTVNDNNPCTTDSCNPSTGVSHTPLAAGSSCSDGNACNGAETCNGSGACVAGAAPTIDDSNPCTTDACNPSTGVSHTPLANGISCSDGNACNGVEKCNGSGTCQPGTAPAVDDGNPCTADSCNPATGVVHSPVAAGTSCSDGNVCNGLETCNGASVCLAGTPLVVSDNNPCTADSCDPSTGVHHTPAATGTLCSDGNACNGLETCNGASACLPGTPPTVDDGNPCTADSCDPSTGVHNTPVSAGTSCSDGNVCNGLEKCNGSGSCQPGAPLAVDDGNPCTTDVCDPSTGVAHTSVANGTSCSDSCFAIL
jgi:hypothetical protein